MTGMNTTPNRRANARKVLRTIATVALPGAPAREVRTWDLGLDGMSLVSPKPIPPGTRCTVTLTLPGDTTLSVPAKTIYCSLLGPEGVKVGVIFTGIDEQAERAIRDFVA